MTWITLYLMLTACGGRTVETVPSPSEAPLNVKTDLALLQQRAAIPAMAASARWVVLPVGITGGTAPGPTDTDMYAWLTFPNGRADVSSLAVATTAPRVSVPDAVAEAILPTSVQAGLEPRPSGGRWADGEALSVSGLQAGIYRPVFAVWLGEGLLLRWRSQ